MQFNWKIEYYRLVGKSSPIFEFIESLPTKAVGKIYNSFDLLAEYGLHLGKSRVKKVIGTPLWELRILGEDSIRIFYIAVQEKTFLLLHAFKKKKQKTPQKEIKIALNRLEEYQQRDNS